MTGVGLSFHGAIFMRGVLAISSLLLFTAACSPQPLSVTREPATLHLVATRPCADLVRDVAAAYGAVHPWVAVSWEVFNNALAADTLVAEEADLACLSWGSMQEVSQSLWMKPIARDGVAVIVHPASSFSAIRLEEVREIFLGRLQEQQGVLLTIVSREDGSGTRAAFESLVLGGESATLNAVVVPSSEAMIDYVARTPGAIGYVSTRCLEDRVRALSVEGVQPTEAAIESGSYPLWRQLQLASSGEPTGEARQFAQWLLESGGVNTLVDELPASP